MHKQIEVVGNGGQPEYFKGEIIARFPHTYKGYKLAMKRANGWMEPALIHMPDGRYLEVNVDLIGG